MKRAGGKPLSIHEMVARRKVAEAQKELREAEADIEEFELHAAEVLVDLLLALCAKVCTAHRSMQSKSQLQANSTPLTLTAAALWLYRPSSAAQLPSMHT